MQLHQAFKQLHHSYNFLLWLKYTYIVAARI